MRKYQIAANDFFDDKEFLEPILRELASTEKITLPTFSFLEVSNQLLNGKISGCILPLVSIPTQKPKNIVIASLSERAAVGEVLVLKKDKVTDGKLLKLEHGATVTVFTKMQKAQLAHFRDDLNFVEKGWNDLFITKEIEIETDAAILPKWYVQNGFSAFEKIEILPEEFIPSGGQGVFAFCCLSTEIGLRRTLKKYHRKETSAVTNIERAIEKALPFPSAVYCVRNQFNHFNIYASVFREGQLYHFSHSSSTSLGLVEKVVSELGG